jgi:glycosyltransferase involved in cell wall biosynthesis
MIREAIIKTDNTYLSQVRKIYTNSEVTSKRLKTFNGIDSTVLYPPLLESAHFTCAEYGDYVFFPSRITQSKRQHLVVEAMRYVTSGTRLIVAGKTEAPEDLARMEKVIQAHRLSSRVTIIDRFISEKEKADLFSRALGCVYIPYDEDSYGYVTLESYHARKAVITCDDSGGTSLVVKNGATGFVVPPQPKAIADAIDRLASDKRKAQAMGEAGYDLMGQLHISWDHVITSLTQ